MARRNMVFLLADNKMGKDSVDLMQLLATMKAMAMAINEKILRFFFCAATTTSESLIQADKFRINTVLLSLVS